MTFIVAEVGSVHDGSFGNACKLIEAAAGCGADAVKFQTHIAEAETLVDAPAPEYFSSEPRYEYFRRTGFTTDQWRRLREVCNQNRISFISSPFSVEAVDLLEDANVDQFKVASGEVTNLPLLEAIAGIGKPVLLSSGMSSWAELDQAVEVLSSGNAEVTVLQCTSAYPCPEERVGLNVLAEMKERYGRPIGFSDHTPGNAAAVAAVTLGATVIEKHLTFSKLMYGSDARFAAEPAQFTDLVTSIRCVDRMLANEVDKDDTMPFREMKAIFEKSVVSTVAIPRGAVITPDMISTKKPGTGMPAWRYRLVIGSVAARDIHADQLISDADLEPTPSPG